MNTRHGEATLVCIFENSEGQMEVVFQIEGLSPVPFNSPIKDNRW